MRSAGCPRPRTARKFTLAVIGCLLALLTGFTPRLVLLLVWWFGNDVERAFDSFLVPLLGLFLLPLTTLMYAITWAPRVGPEGFDWFLIVLAFLIDLSSYGGGARAQRARTERA